jgi:amphi-Trp domain-containing protein
MSKEKIEVKRIVESGRAIALFEEILNLMKEGGAHFEHDGQSIDLTAGEATEMEIEIKHKDGKQKLELELVWTDGLHLGGTGEDTMADLKVSSRKTEEPVGEMAHRNVSAETFGEQSASEAALF